MSRRQFLSIVLGTTLFLVVGLAIANYYFGEENISPNNSIQFTEGPLQEGESSHQERLSGIIEGRIVGVTDGDTVKVLTPDNGIYIIRLAGIDAPEHAQDFGNKSKEYLSSLIFDQTVRINATKLDKYGRVVGQIFLDQKDINLEILRSGLAWHYKKYEREQTEIDRKLYADAESQARKQKLGVWSMPLPIPPWEFRHPELSPPNP